MVFNRNNDSFPTFYDNGSKPSTSTNFVLFDCEAYSYECPNCTSQNRSCETEGDHVKACFATWSVSRKKNETKLLHKGCWSDSKSLRHCLSERCAASKPHKKPDDTDDSIFFCCCHKPRCNEKFEYDPYLSSISENEATNLESVIHTNISKLPDPHFNARLVQNHHILLWILVSLMIFAVIAWICYYVYRKLFDGGRSRFSHNITNKPMFSDRGEIAPLKMIIDGKEPKNDDTPNGLRKPVDKNHRVELIKVISEGRFATVYTAKCFSSSSDSAKNKCSLPLDDRSETDEIVAVKVFSKRCFKSCLDEYEIYKLPALRNNLILHFLRLMNGHNAGMSLTNELWLITEYHPNGSIYDYLKRNILSFHQMLHIARTVLAGLTFLHEEISGGDDCPQKYKPCIVHRDVKSRNILLKHDLTACLADFGLALQCREGRPPGEIHNQVGTYRYMAPEVLEIATDFSAFAFKQIDVYATALVLWELITRCRCAEDEIIDEHRLPFELELGSGLKPAELKVFVAVKRNRPKLEDRWLSDHIRSSYCRTIVEMWDHEPEARLTASCALRRLEDMEQSYAHSTQQRFVQISDAADNSVPSFSLTTSSANENQMVNVQRHHDGNHPTYDSSCVMYNTKRDEATALIASSS